MVKTISFSVVEILPALLDKSKTQTIRPAWKLSKDTFISHSSFMKGKLNEKYKKILDKPPRFKVGDKVRLYWKQRSKCYSFCSKCGGDWTIRNPTGKCDHLHFPDYTDKNAYRFNKILGEGEITEIFEIEIGKKKSIGNSIYYIIGEKKYSSWIFYPDRRWNVIGDLAKKDGFSDSWELNQYLNNNYDLSNPKKFYVYKWKWRSHKVKCHN